MATTEDTKEVIPAVDLAGCHPSEEGSSERGILRTEEAMTDTTNNSQDTEGALEAEEIMEENSSPLMTTMEIDRDLSIDQGSGIMGITLILTMILVETDLLDSQKDSSTRKGNVFWTQKTWREVLSVESLVSMILLES